jgi:hypothetical protein
MILNDHATGVSWALFFIVSSTRRDVLCEEQICDAVTIVGRTYVETDRSSNE